MSIARQLDMMIGDGEIDAPELNQNFYVGLERFIRYCAANGLCNIIASQTNNGGVTNLANYHDEANPAGENAFICSEWDQGTGQTFYLLIQWADASAFGNSPGNPGLLLASGSGSADGVGVQMVVRDDGSNPWNGTSNDDGQDTKGTPVWTDGGSTVRVFPRSNATGGSHATNKENMAEIIDLATTNELSRAHFAADEDCFFIVLDKGDDHSTYVSLMCGHYTPLPDLAASLTTPYFMFLDSNTNGGIRGGQPFGDTAGNDPDQGGAVGIPANDVRIAFKATPQFGTIPSVLERAQYQPNNVGAADVLEILPVGVLINEGADVGLAGTVTSVFGSGQWGYPRNHVLEDLDGEFWAILGDDIADQKFIFPWDENMAPGNGRTRGGRQSFTP